MLENIELNLLAGDSIPFIDMSDVNKPKVIGNIHPFTVGDIKSIGGEHVFNSYLGVLTINKERISKGKNGEVNPMPDLTDFELTYLLCEMDDFGFKELYLNAISFIFRDKVNICDRGFYVGELRQNKIINNTNYHELSEIIKVQNCLTKPNSKLIQDNPGSEKARELLEKRRQLREKLNKIKNKDNENGEPLTFSDLISILCSNGNGINIFNVWDLSYYAFNDQFNRMKMFEDYQVDIRSILAGADPKEVDIKHWMSRID